ncbi:MAG: hypothetical protein HY726_09075 [Candidatus Rokubacteria bacterium]|nr:hypothetical protein [Candidatus Rokubacteria bacterium]
MERYLRALTPNRCDERGVAFPLALMALMVFAALSAAILTIGGSEVQISANLLRDTQARFMAEAGLEEAFNYYRSDTSRLPASTAAYSTTVTTITGNFFGPGDSLSGYGSYAVTAQTVGPYTVLITSTGTSATGSASKVLRTLVTIGFTSNDAIRNNGDFDRNGSGSRPTTAGTCGSAHANEDFTKDGNPTFEQGLTATGSAESPGTGSKPKKTVPTISSADLRKTARATNPTTTFDMKPDGTVVDGDNASQTPTCTVTGSGAGAKASRTFRGWKWEVSGSTCTGTSTWSLTSDTSASGATYYFQQDVDLTGGPSMQATIITTGNIQVSGNVSLTPHLTDTLLIADKDIDLGGNPASTVQGLIAVHEQIKLQGNVKVTGFILAENAAAVSSLVTASPGAVQISGNPQVEYNCGGSPPIPGPIRFLAWGI